MLPDAAAAKYWRNRSIAGAGTNPAAAILVRSRVLMLGRGAACRPAKYSSVPTGLTRTGS